MISAGAASSCVPNGPSSSSQVGLQMYNPQLADHEDIVLSSIEATGSHSSSLLYNLSVLKDKVHQVQSLVSILISPDQPHAAAEPNATTSLAIASMGSLVQEIIVTASSMIFICQQMSLGTTPSSAGNNNNNSTIHHQLHQQQQQQQHQVPSFSTHENCVENIVQERGGLQAGQQGLYSSTGPISSWYGTDLQVVSNDDNKVGIIRKELPRRSEVSEGSRPISPRNYDIIELDAADLLAKYTHYCQFCGKGFKRDANLRMHMRAHGDEYKTSAALTNPMKNRDEGSGGGAGPNCSTKFPKKYSCPQEGCRWNQKHAKFQPLKSMICVKNHYKRSHCPKMYVCKRCNRKQFSVLSDLRTHEKHCGDLKWQCSCGTTFSRKDKLMGHVALFVGHTPLVTATPLTKPGGQPQHLDTTMQLDDRG